MYTDISDYKIYNNEKSELYNDSPNSYVELEENDDFNPLFNRNHSLNNNSDNNDNSNINNYKSVDKYRGTQKYLRYPILIIICMVIFIEFIFYLLLRFLVLLYEFILYILSFITCGKNIRKLKYKLKLSKNFNDYYETAIKLDTIENFNNWKRIDESPYYDYKNVKSILLKMKIFINNKDYNNLLSLLSDIYTRNVAHNTIDNELLYKETYFGTKYLISDFIKEVINATKLISKSNEIDRSVKLSFIKRCKRAYGRTALCLSGGGSFAYFHFGVIKALIESNSLPTIISGCSGGAMVAAWIGVRTDEEVKELITPELYKYITPCSRTWWQRLKSLYTTGALFDWKEWIELTKVSTFGDTTFEEAYKRTGKILNISMTSSHKHSTSIVLNYVSAPHVCIWSAVIASSAIPMILTPVMLHAKQEDGSIVPYLNFGPCFSDGTIKNDLPMKQLSESFNCNYFIVSQANPHIVPLAFNTHGHSGPTFSNITSSKFRGGFISSALETALRLEMRKWIQVLGELDLLPDLFNQDWRQILLQVTSGDVTIIATPSLRDYLRIVDDPTKEDMEHYINCGQLSTYPKLSMLSNHYVFEKIIGECLFNLELESDRNNAIGVPVAINK